MAPKQAATEPEAEHLEAEPEAESSAVKRIRPAFRQMTLRGEPLGHHTAQAAEAIDFDEVEVRIVRDRKVTERMPMTEWAERPECVANRAHWAEMERQREADEELRPAIETCGIWSRADREAMQAPIGMAKRVVCKRCLSNLRTHSERRRSST